MQDPTAWTSRTSCVPLLPLPESLSAWVRPGHRSDTLAGHTLLPTSDSNLALPTLPLPEAATWLAAELSCTPPVTATAQMPGKIKWTQEQDGSMEIEALECLKIIFLWQRKSGWKERISKLHGFSFQKKEHFRDGEGVGKRRRGHNIFWASLQFTFNSWQVSLSIKKKRKRLEKS